MKWLVILALQTCTSHPDKLPEVEECWENRKTVQQMENVEGVIHRDADWVYIALTSGRQLFPCNLPDAYQTSDSVVFSANQKETLPNERWAGDPIELTRIRHKETMD